MRCGPYAATLILALLAAGCATAPPVEQVQLFNRAFVNVQTASQPLFDDLAIAERRAGRENAVAKAQEKFSGPAEASQATQACREGMPGWRGDTSPQAPGFITGFCIEDAAYFSDLGDPPATRAFRNGINVLTKYSELLLILAEGRNIEAARTQIQSIGTSVSAGLALVPGAQAAAVAVLPALRVLNPLIEEAAKANNLDELKRIVAGAAPHFSRLTAELQGATPRIFNVLAGQSMQQATPANLKNRPVAEALTANVDGYRRILSDYVLLLQELDLAHKELIAAVQSDGRQTLAGLAERGERLTRTAEAMRQSFVTLRRREAQ